ncbi:hypothetical protein DPMN_054844 [Dreissena polymorpha]|uniref:Uncharacterized protein n=1 Tax=Dreissena polymorpha TaxID=45954 RepID=A0A9D4CQ91_DREPO|nr:hypothetical protein DPMN_052061 [Dreissena polymorpha]KAH3728881.1 hypothetical protein DPMN_054844 [Dreissena polymorpha]
MQDENGSTIVDINAQDDISSSSDEGYSEERSIGDSDYQSDQESRQETMCTHVVVF